MKKFIEELKRRNVIKATIAYLVVAWILLQVMSILLDIFNSPDWIKQTFTIILAIGLPVWIIVSWIYDITPKGIEVTSKDPEKQIIREVTSKRLNVFIIVSLSIAVIVMGLKISNVFESSDKQYAIAVLPFKDMSPENTQWFCDGVMDEILNHFSTLKSLRVISRTSSDTYRGTDKKIPEIAKELDVDYILEGSVTLYNNEVKIMAQLITANDEHIWSKDYNNSFDNIFTIQQNVSKDIFKKLKITLSPEQEEIIDRIPTQNMEAFDLFLKGRSLANTRNKEDLEKSIELFQQAVDLDPNYADAYAEMAQSYFLLGSYLFINLDEYKEKIKGYIEKALTINPNIVRAYTVMGMLDVKVNNDYESAKENFEKAIALNPNDATAHHHYSQYYFYKPIKDVNNRLIHLKIAQRLDPFSYIINNLLFYTLIDNHKIDEAEEYYKKWNHVIPEESKFFKGSYLKAIKNKDWTEAIRFFEKEIEKDPYNGTLYRILGSAYNGILNDDSNYIKYTKKAYEFDSIHRYSAVNYFNALVEGKKFAAAQKLMQSNNFKSVRSKRQQLESLWYYYYNQENYLKTQEVLTDTLMKEAYYQKALNYAQLGDRKNLDNLMKKDLLTVSTKAFVYAILKERDSMYYYLDKKNDAFGIRDPNGRREFDPYRKEERYKALLKKNYLPLTHWNE